MSDIALSVRGLTKEYQILHNAEKHDRVTDAVANSVKGIFRKKEVEAFKALDDVSFDVKKGEVLGVIGRNGAGKSTLLKVLSRITEPTSGEIHLFGRVGSLLEVGTGFHPELTGRENIFLNGAILGMRRREIERQFDEIVDFAEVEKFLDTPVKRYSSGMYVRLAFAVAAHLNPEILIVDEVLAVGDLQFQKKCLGKMQDVSRQDGRTVLFVSHNMAAVKSLCTQSLLLKAGKVTSMGESSAVVSAYLGESLSNAVPEKAFETNGVTLANLTISRPSISDDLRTLWAYEDYRLEVSFEFKQPQSRVGIAITLRDEEEATVSSICTPEEGIGWVSVNEKLRLNFSIPDLPLTPGRYAMEINVYGTGAQVKFENAAIFEVMPTIAEGGSCAYSREHGLLRLARNGSAEIDNKVIRHHSVA